MLSNLARLIRVSNKGLCSDWVVIKITNISNQRVTLECQNIAKSSMTDKQWPNIRSDPGSYLTRQLESEFARLSV